MWHADPLEVHPLRRDDNTSVLFVRFPAGWTRRGPAICAAAEEFVVLDGSIEVNGSLLGPGSVAHVPAGAVRATTTSAAGCTAVAWFLGPLRWDAAPAAEASPLLTWHPWDGPGGGEWSTPVATWSLMLAHSDAPGPTPGDVVDLDDRAWAPLTAGVRPPHPRGSRMLHRMARTGHEPGVPPASGCHLPPRGRSDPAGTQVEPATQPLRPG